MVLVTDSDASIRDSVPAGPGDPLFSIVIPTFNRVDLLQQALDSVFSQRFVSYEVVIVDDGSTDSTPAFLRTLEPSVTVLTQSNNGPGAARNLGAGKARGAYLALLDSDDIWFPWTLDTYARILRESGNPVMLAGRPRRFDGVARGGLPEQTKAQWIRFDDYLSSGDHWRWYGVSSFVISRSRFLQAGGFAPEFRVGEDADLALRLGVESGFVQVIAPATFGYREHKDNMSGEPRACFDAAAKLVRAESVGAYPGGASRCRERRRIIARHVRPAAIAAAREGMIGGGFALYATTFVWQLAAGAWRFVLGYPLLAAFCALAPARRAAT